MVLASNNSKKKEIIFAAIIIVGVIGGFEAAANYWWYEVYTCAFETAAIFSDLDAETKRKQCIEFMDLVFTTNKINQHRRF